jgi:hypothetical protein
MAFGSASKVFIALITDWANNTTAIDLNTDASIKTTLYGNTGTPDNTVSSANSAFNAGQWVTGNEVTATGWPTGGLALASVTSTSTSATYTFDAADRAGGATDTVTNAYGVLVYDDTIATPVADQGLCYNAFGGANSVTSGTFTVVWHTSGIFTIAA